MSHDSRGNSPQQPPPYYPYPGHPPAPTQGISGLGIIIAIVAGISTLLGISCCGGILVLFYIGTGTQAEQIKEQLQFNPVLTQYVGPVISFEMDRLRSLTTPDEDVFFYHVVGTKRGAIIRVREYSGDDGREKIIDAHIITPEGNEIPLFVPINQQLRRF